MTQQVCLGHVGATVARQPTETANRTKNKREREKKTAQKKSYLLGYHITYCHVHACHMCDMLDFGNFSVDRRPICLHCSGFYVILPGKSRLRDDILCVEWDVKLYTHSLTCSIPETFRVRVHYSQVRTHSIFEYKFNCKTHINRF